MADDRELKAQLTAAETALERAIKREAEMEDRYRGAIADIVHDVKNPLAAMMGYISLLRSEALGPLGRPEYKEYAETIDTACNRLLTLCNSLLSEYVDTELTEPEPDTPLDASAMVEEIKSLFSAQARERGIALNASIDSQFPNLRASPREMHRALTNLVSNAVKFTPSGGKIDIDAQVDPTDDTFIMVIRDSGIGMTREQIDRLLASHQSDAPATPDKGSGQGIAIVNRIVRELGGKLEIVSTENRGTRIKMKLPGSISVRKQQVVQDFSGD